MSTKQVDASNALRVCGVCRVLKASASGDCAWHHRSPTVRTLADLLLTEGIRKAHKDSDETCQMPQVRVELRGAGHKISRIRVARLIPQACIPGVSRRRSFIVATERNARQCPAPDLVNREFRAGGPDQLWIADMTYIPTWTGFMHLAVGLDAFSRTVVGWSMGEQMTTELVLAALNRAGRCTRADPRR